MTQLNEKDAIVGGKDMSEAVNDVQYEYINLGLSEDKHFVSSWFSVDVTHEPLKLMVKLERNPDVMPRHLQLYVDMARKNIFGKQTTVHCQGYRIYSISLVKSDGNVALS